MSLPRDFPHKVLVYNADKSKKELWMPTTWLEFPGDIDLMTLDDNEAEAICMAYCQNDDDCKTECFSDNCPLGQTEIRRLTLLRHAELKKRKRGFTPNEAAAAAVIMATACF